MVLHLNASIILSLPPCVSRLILCEINGRVVGKYSVKPWKPHPAYLSFKHTMVPDKVNSRLCEERHQAESTRHAACLHWARRLRTGGVASWHVQNYLQMAVAEVILTKAVVVVKDLGRLCLGSPWVYQASHLAPRCTYANVGDDYVKGMEREQECLGTNRKASQCVNCHCICT